MQRHGFFLSVLTACVDGPGDGLDDKGFTEAGVYVDEQAGHASEVWSTPSRHKLNDEFGSPPESDYYYRVGGAFSELWLTGNHGLYWEYVKADEIVTQSIVSTQTGIPDTKGVYITRSYRSEVPNGQSPETSEESEPPVDMLEIEMEYWTLGVAADYEEMSREDIYAEVASFLEGERSSDFQQSRVRVSFKKEGLSTWRDAYPMTLQVDPNFAGIGLMNIGSAFVIEQSDFDNEGDMGSRLYRATMSCEDDGCWATIEIVGETCEPELAYPGAPEECEFNLDIVDGINHFESEYASGKHSLCDPDCFAWEDAEATALEAANTAPTEILAAALCGAEATECDEAHAIVAARPFDDFEALDRVREESVEDLNDALIRAANLVQWPFEDGPDEAGASDE